MEIDRLVGVFVTDEEQYQQYREHMMPLLESHGGRFIVDVRVSEVLRSPTDTPFNRMFTIRFPDEAAMTALFSSEAYAAVRDRYFTPSVSATAPLATYGVLP